ncbi:type II secretion system GspH family protein [Synergistaceae bacterium OttesenSCG-928-I11]|nr:type II secretion system GspH family protein [Synergistaceae bacterium OttesenSCG-928-I11]
MVGKTSATCLNFFRKIKARHGGFSLVELVIVMLLMVIVMGVAASLLYGMMTMYQVTSDQTVARRRAQDVFNILKVSLQNAGIGVPAGNFDYYFGGSRSWGSDKFISAWDSPVEVSANPKNSGSVKYGDVLKVVYSLPAGLKYEGKAEYTFSDVNPEDNVADGVLLKFVGASFDLVVAPGNPASILPDQKGNVRSFITFPGMDTHPLFVEKATAGSDELELTVGGVTPKSKNLPTSLDILARNVIRPYADLYLLHASVAFVDDNSTFYMLDVVEDDPVDPSLPTDPAALPGFRVEGIKSIRFLPGQDKRQITVWVLAEGDIADSGRNERSATMNAIKSREFKYRNQDGIFETESLWDDVDFDDDVYYEDFFMTWRIRNLQVD